MGSLEDDSGSESNDNDNISEVYIPGKSKQVYELEADPSAYIFLHRLQAGMFLSVSVEYYNQISTYGINGCLGNDLMQFH